MSKSLPMSAFAIGVFASGCDPVTTSVVELSTRDGSAVVVKKDARVTQEPDDKDGNTLQPPEPDGCLVLVDQSIAEIADPAVVAGRFVQARTAKKAGCVDADAGMMLLNASVFSRRDGEPMVERGKRYSYRWMTDTAMNIVRLQGGDEACAEETVVNFTHGPFQSAPSGFASCYEFVSPIEARYLRNTAADYIDPWALLNLGRSPTELRLCTSACPPGTEHDFTTDAGTPDGGRPAYDAAVP